MTEMPKLEAGKHLVVSEDNRTFVVLAHNALLEFKEYGYYGWHHIKDVGKITGVYALFSEFENGVPNYLHLSPVKECLIWKDDDKQELRNRLMELHQEIEEIKQKLSQ